MDNASCKTAEFTDHLFKFVPPLLGERKAPADGGRDGAEATDEHLEDGLDEVCEAEPEDDDKSIGSVCIGLSEHLDELVYGGDGMYMKCVGWRAFKLESGVFTPRGCSTSWLASNEWATGGWCTSVVGLVIGLPRESLCSMFRVCANGACCWRCTVADERSVGLIP